MHYENMGIIKEKCYCYRALGQNGWIFGLV